MNLHTSAEQVGEVAAAANAKHVILSHYSPTDLPDSEWLDAIGKHFSGRSPSPATARSSSSDPFYAPRRWGSRSPKSRIAFSELTFRRVTSAIG